jgi:hypothetical protein
VANDQPRALEDICIGSRRIISSEYGLRVPVRIEE